MSQNAKKELSCFIIMPFTAAKCKKKKLNKVQLKYIYEEFFCKAVKSYQNENFNFSNVSRYEGSRGNFVKGIVANLYNADLVIADLTGQNPNVFYELGIRHTLKNGTILLTQDIGSLPSDLGSYIAFEYEYPDISEMEKYYPKFESQLHRCINEFVKDINHPDNPVKDFLQIKNIIKDEQRKRDILTNIRLLSIICEKYVQTISHLITLFSSFAKGENQNRLLISLGVEPILNRMVNLNESNQLIIFLQNLILSEAINNHNMNLVKGKLIKEKNLEVIRDIPFFFKDTSQKMHHILDLFNYHTANPDNKAILSEPIFLSFISFTGMWRLELQELEK